MKQALNMINDSSRHKTAKDIEAWQNISDLKMYNFDGYMNAEKINTPHLDSLNSESKIE